MDKPIRKFILWKCRNLNSMRDRLEVLKERKQEIIDESSGGIDGQPKAKYSFGNVVESKVLKLEDIDYSIQKIEHELKTITEFQKSLTGYERQVYDETIAKESNIEAKADFLHVCRKVLIKDRGRLLRQVASRLGEYIDKDKE